GSEVAAAQTQYYLKYFNPDIVYPKNARIMLDTGVVVMSMVDGNSTNPNSNMTGWVRVNSASLIFDQSGKTQQEINDSQKQKLPSLKDYGAVSGQDSTAAIKAAIAAEDFLYFGDIGDNFIVSEQIDLRDGCYYVSNGAKFTAALGIEGSQPYTPKSIINASGKVGINISGLVRTHIDHNIFSALGDANSKPTISGFLADAAIDCDFGKWESVGSVNYYYTPNFKEYGIVDLRNSIDCYIEADVNGRWTEETTASTPSTVGIMGSNNKGCYLKGRAKNCYWSGILWEGEDCVVDGPHVRNTKGSNLNLAGKNTAAYNVDLYGSEQGNISIGEGATQAENCNVVGGVAGNAKFANCHLHSVTKNCHVKLFHYGWGQTASAVSDATSGIRCQGTGNTIDSEFDVTYGGLTVKGDAVNVYCSTLTNPEATNIKVNVVGIGARVQIRAPYTIVNAKITGATGDAVVLGERCKGSIVEEVTAIKCGRPLQYAPKTTDANDYAGVIIGRINDVECTNRSVFYGQKIVHSQRKIERIYAQETAFVLDQVLEAIEVYTNDSGVTGANKLASAIRHISADSFGTSYGLDLVASTISKNNLANSKTKVRAGHIEVEPAVAGAASHIVLYAANGTKWKLEPTGSASAANWVAV
uniref:Tailspike depolymerase (APK16_gp47) from Acinetobacter phage APK16 n=1 Tax=Acinetobacter phage APK16 TaxID=2873388 RepID=UPI0024C47347|nr:Chain A, Tailspike depolymerase (APK16_gp47) from Acinetobacter phage APK16 [Acinetobacter phage APK16]